MEISSLLIALALLILVVAFVARPILEQAASPGEAPPSAPADELVTQREAVLIELRDLDFDHATGKVSEEDYAAQRARLVAKGTEVLRALDALSPAGGGADDDVERAVAARRGGGVAPLALDSDDEIERAVAARRRRAKAAAGPSPKEAAACPSCAAPFQPGDKFCPNCGTSLALACPHCGQPIRPGDKFCAKCGTKLVAAPEAV